MFPYPCRTVTLGKVCIVPCKNIPPVKCLCIVELVSKSTVQVFPKRHVRKTLASILSEKATAVIKEEREIYPDFVALNRLSSSQAISDSN